MHLPTQDFLTILASIVGPIGTMLGFMWYHFNTRFEKIDGKIDNLRNELKNDLNQVEQRSNLKIDDAEQRLTKEVYNVERRLTEKIDDVEQRLTEKVDGVEQRLSKGIDNTEQRLTKEIYSVKQELNAKTDVLNGKVESVRERTYCIESKVASTKVIPFGELDTKDLPSQKTAINQL